MLNKMMIIGRLGKTPELKTTPSGTMVTSFGVATTEKWKDASGEKKEETQWHNVVIWGKRAETACKYMKKGELHLFEGTMKYEKYPNKTHPEIEMIAPKLHILDFKLLPQGNSQGHTPDDTNVPPGYTSGGRSSDEPDASGGSSASGGGSNVYDDSNIPF